MLNTPAAPAAIPNTHHWLSILLRAPFGKPDRICIKIIKYHTTPKIGIKRNQAAFTGDLPPFALITDAVLRKDRIYMIKGTNRRHRNSKMSQCQIEKLPIVVLPLGSVIGNTLCFANRAVKRTFVDD